MKKPRIYKLLAVIGLMLAMAAGWPLAGRAEAAEVAVYGDGLAAEWANWSWSCTLNFAVTTPVHGGTKSLSVKYNAAWAGLYLHPYSTYDTRVYDRLSFWIHGGSTGNQRLLVIANGDTTNSYAVTAQANTWTQVIVPLSALGSPATLTDLYWQDATGGAQPVFYLDDIALLATNPPAAPTLSIDAGTGRHGISEYIYGMNYADEALAAELRLPVRRWGGNSTTRYNWRTSMTNTVADWYFENLPVGTVVTANLPDGSASDQFVEQDRRTGTKSILTVPLIGRTAKATSPRNHPYDCGFKVSKYGAQQSVDPWDTNCGNGLYSNGTDITGNDPADTSEPIGPDFVSSWIAHLVGRYGSAATSGVAFYDLDNEPMLWNSTHRDIHPQPATYDEIRDRTYQYAPAIKAADPTARTLGPVLWGWCAYFYSALDGCGIGTDYQTHGNQPFVPWYLGQMRAYEQQHGLRILDYLDLHYYPQASGVALSSAGNASTQALRLRSTRSLWDTTYTDESWISDTQTGGVKVQLIPRIRDWVDTWYPGTRLAITEYNWGGLEDINGALAQADVLGIFGREGLDLATLWSPPTAAQPGAFAFRLYRNYDGAGHGFGDIAVQAVSTDQGALAVYAAERGSDHALTVVVINKTVSDITSPLGITGRVLPATAAVYRYSATNLNTIQHLPDQTLGATGLTALFPANSATLFVIAPATGGTTATLTVARNGNGSVAASTGTITWNGTTGTGSYSLGTPVTLTATSATGSAVSAWSGCDSSSGNVCTLTMNASRVVTVSFTAPTCTFSLSSAAQRFGRNGGKGSLKTTASSASCQWTAQSTVPWITLPVTTFTGTATVSYTVAKNTTGAARTGTLTIAGQIFTVTQSK